MVLLQDLSPESFRQISFGYFHLFSVSFLALSITTLYRLFWHPLSHIPGPRHASISSAFLYTICYLGIEGRMLAHYHRKYNTPVLRVAPDAVSVSDEAALHPIYVAGGGLPKDARYENFRIEGHDTIFSACETAYRDSRAKTVLPLFAPSRIRGVGDGEDVISRCVEKFVAMLEREKSLALRVGDSARKVDILDLCSKLSIDVVTGYLFDKVYGGLNEDENDADVPPSKSQTSSRAQKKENKLSATPFVLAIVALSRFSLLPSNLFSLIFPVLAHLEFSSEEVSQSMQTVDRFVSSVMGEESRGKDADTYQSLLLASGITPTETEIQCKAVMFAGADSTAVKLATILFHLVQNPDVRQRLGEEIEQTSSTADPQSLPYLRAVIKEGLRLGMANPARLTRIVPHHSSGINASGFHLPPDTIVGASAYVLHHNPELFPAPFEFRPERWLDGDCESGVDASMRKRREKAVFPFGLGARACLGRNLAMRQLFLAVRAVVRSGVLDGGKMGKDRIELVEWFNAEIKGHELEIEW